MKENAKTPRAAKVHGRACPSVVDAPGKIWHPVCLPIPSFKPMSGGLEGRYHIFILTEFIGNLD